MDKLEVFECYLDLGWKLLPCHWIEGGECSCGNTECRSPGKHPLIPNGLKGSSNDISIVKSWLEQWPQMNVGVATGSRSGVLCVDIDVANTEIGKYLGGMVAQTGGGGKHHVFKVPQTPIRSSISKLEAGVDIRADGGYFMAYPSNHVSGDYVWIANSPLECGDLEDAPEWLVEKLLAGGSGGSGDHKNWMDVRSLPDEEVVNIREALGVIPSENRETWVKVGMALKGFLNDSTCYPLWVQWSSKCEEKFNGADCKRVWGSFKWDGGIGTGTLFKIADDYRCTIQVQAPEEAKAEPVENVKTPEVIRELVDIICENSILVQPSMAEASVISFISAISSGKWSVRDTRTNLYTVCLSPTGTGKNYYKKVLKALRLAGDVGKIAGGSEIKSGPGIVKRVKKYPTALYILDEFGLTLNRALGKNASGNDAEIIKTLMELYSSSDSEYTCGDYSDDRKNYKDPIILNPHVVAHCLSTPETFYQALSSDHIHSGFVGRFFVVNGEEDPLKQDEGGKPPLIPMHIKSWIKDLFNSNDREVGRTDEAKRIFKEWEDLAEHNMKNARGSGQDGVWSRSMELADKLSMIGAFGNRSEIVESESAKWAIAKAKSSVRTIIAKSETDIGGNSTSKAIREAYHVIKRLDVGEGAKQSEIFRRNPFRGMMSKNRKELLTTMHEMGYIYKKPHTTNNSGNVWKLCK